MEIQHIKFTKNILLKLLKHFINILFNLLLQINSNGLFNFIKTFIKSYLM
jgi:hypothetical protein